MNRVELLVQAMNDRPRPQSERDLAARSLRDIASTSADPAERRAARRAAGIDDLLGLGTRPSASPAPSSPETSKPINEPTPAPEPTRVGEEQSDRMSRLTQILAGAHTNMQELSALLEPKTKELLRIDYAKELKLKRIQESVLLAERRKYLDERAIAERFEPVNVGNIKFYVDPLVRDEIVGIRDRGTYTIRNCAKHRRERCPCFWDGARPELLAFRERYGPSWAEWKLASAIYSELEEMARAHIPGRNHAMRTEHLEDSTPAEWIGRRKR